MPVKTCGTHPFWKQTFKSQDELLKNRASVLGFELKAYTMNVRDAYLLIALEVFA